MVPEGLCIYCGGERPARASELRCRGCGRTAEGVRWWRAGGGDGAAVDEGAAGTLAACASGLAFTAAPASLRALVIDGGVSAAVGFAAAALFARVLFGAESGRWRFASGDGEWRGAASWRGGALAEAWCARPEAAAIEVPAYASAITSTALRAAGPLALGPGVRLALRLDARARGAGAAPTEAAALLVASLVGIAARGSVALHRLRGWRRERSLGGRARPLADVALAPGAAPVEALPFERAVVLAVAAAADENARRPPLPPGDAPHYRAASARPAARWCLVADAARALDADAAALGLVGRDRARADEVAMAFRAFAEAQPDVVERLATSLAARV